MKKTEKAFYHGFAAAVSFVARFGHEDIAEHTMEENNITLSDLEKAGCDEYDLVAIRKLDLRTD